jgi:hypothetical protein
MPKGESPYLPLAQGVVKTMAARGAFLYISDGALGESWAVWAPPEVAARLPEFLDAAAEELLSEDATRQDSSLVVLPEHRQGEKYHELAEWICKRAQGDICILYVIEGRNGSGWAVYAAPEYSATMLSELMHGFASDLKREEPMIREEAGLEVLPIG